mgnify:CR=1 FL=1
MPETPTADATVTCYACGYSWNLVWLVAQALFKRLSGGRYECGPTSCPQCNPRLASYWRSARASLNHTYSRVAPVNVPTDDTRVKGETPRARSQADP